MLIDMIVEMPKGTKHKYEFEKETNTLVLDRVLLIPMPETYGYVPNTLATDGDPLDIFLIGLEEVVPPGTKIKVAVVGMLKCLDKGIQDDKLIAIMPNAGELIWKQAANIVKYLRTYKSNFEVIIRTGAPEAIAAYMECRQAYE